MGSYCSCLGMFSMIISTTFCTVANLLKFSDIKIETSPDCEFIFVLRYKLEPTARISEEWSYLRMKHAVSNLDALHPRDMGFFIDLAQGCTPKRAIEV